MEEVYRFPLLRLTPFDVPPPFVIPAFAEMTESGIASIPQCKNDLPDLGVVYSITFAKGSNV